MKNKAQIAMETIMVYGAAILVVTLAIGALMYFGVLDMSGLLPDKCSVSGNVVCENYVATAGSTGGLQLEFRNRVGKNIKNVNVTVKGIDDWEGTDFSEVQVADGTLNNGELGLANLSNSQLPAGSKYKGQITLMYQVVGSNIKQKLLGEIQVKIAK